MTTDRTYRTALPLDEALAELRRHAGLRFDPAVVDALLRSVGSSEASARPMESA
jgi:HD-GYP domain-containing protein (c-di-GMP phosphodiesterase class II)